MHKAVLAASLCLWAGVATAGETNKQATYSGIPAFAAKEFIGAPTGIATYVPSEVSPQLQKQLDAIQTQLKCIWLPVTLEIHQDTLAKCDEAFKNVNPK